MLESRQDVHRRRVENYLGHFLEKLQKIVGPAEHTQAGPSGVVDPMGVADATVANLTLCILDGREHSQIKSAIEGDSFNGTIVQSEEEE